MERNIETCLASNLKCSSIWFCIEFRIDNILNLNMVVGMKLQSCMITRDNDSLSCICEIFDRIICIFLDFHIAFGAGKVEITSCLNTFVVQFSDIYCVLVFCIAI